MIALTAKSEQRLHWFFTVSLLVKAALASGEILSAIGVFVVRPGFIVRFIAQLTRGELAEDPHDLIANYLLHWARHLSVDTQHFVALYLLSHGIVKLWLIVGLLRERLWYYPSAVVVFGLFIAYQLYRYSHTYSVWLLVITVIDIIVVALTVHEYRYLRHAGQWAR